MTDMQQQNFVKTVFDRTFKLSSYQYEGSAADELREGERNPFDFTGKQRWTSKVRPSEVCFLYVVS